MSLKKAAIFNKLLNGRRPGLAVLIDPDKYNSELVGLAERNGVGCFFIGGSELKNNNFEKVVADVRKKSGLPIIIFPGDEKQISAKADGILLLSLVSGRNPEYLIGKHVKAAAGIKRSKLKTFPTAYILVGGGRKSTTQKITQTEPIKESNTKLLLSTAIASEQLGFSCIYLEAGSGAKKNVSVKNVKAVRKTVNIPVIVGGGVDSPEKAKTLVAAGANLIVVGNALERNIELIREIGKVFS